MTKTSGGNVVPGGVEPIEPLPFALCRAVGGIACDENACKSLCRAASGDRVFGIGVDVGEPGADAGAGGIGGVFRDCRQYHAGAGERGCVVDGGDVDGGGGAGDVVGARAVIRFDGQRAGAVDVKRALVGDVARSGEVGVERADGA